MRVALLGDIALFSDGMLRDGWEKRLEEVEKILSTCDIVVANLETPVTQRRFTLVCKGMHLKTDERIIPILKYLHVNVVDLANNHICDFGLQGMMDTLKLLEKNNIFYYGINHLFWNAGESQQDSITFHGFCCYSTNGAKYAERKKQLGVNPLTEKNIRVALEQDKANHRLSVLSTHWGDEYSPYPNAKQVEFMHMLAMDYNFVLYGHHAHVMQGIEKVNNALLAYNQGNFCFDECRSPVNPKLVIRQSNLCRESYILIIEAGNGMVKKWETVGIKYTAEGIHIVDNMEHIRRLSDSIPHCHEGFYKNEVKEIIKQQKINNLSRHDWKWFRSKFNYYAIGAKLLSYRNAQKYRRSFMWKL